VNLSGTGGAATAYQVNLSWTAPSSSPDPVAGYNIYRSPSGQSSYQLMGSVAASEFAYMDGNNIQDGATYDYIVESVDSSGNESVPSNTASVQIP
jgi:fibronectin type 3 domain-containing protein